MGCPGVRSEGLGEGKAWRAIKCFSFVFFLGVMGEF